MLALGASVLALISACTTGGGSATPTTGAVVPTTAPATAATATVAPATVAPATTAPATTAPATAEASAPAGSPAGQKPTIKVGSDGFDEAKIMAEIYAQALEAGGYTVDRAGIGIGARDVSAGALDKGQINLKPEYIGSGIGFYAKSDPTCAVASPAPASPAAPAAGCVATGDPAANMGALQALLKGKGITVLNFTPAADQNAFVVRPDTATANNLTKMSDTTAVQDKIKWGLATDCATNVLCGAPGGALQALYGITQKTIDGATLLGACSQPMADALKAKTIDLGELCSTQPDIATNGWVLLQDDKQSQPADNIAPLVRDDVLAAVDMTSFEKILNDVSAKMDTATLTKLYASVAVDHKDIKDVAEGWLKDNGLHP